MMLILHNLHLNVSTHKFALSPEYSYPTLMTLKIISFPRTIEINEFTAHATYMKFH